MKVEKIFVIVVHPFKFLDMKKSAAAERNYNKSVFVIRNSELIK